MLVLTRKARQRIFIDCGKDRIIVEVCEITNGKVRIGVDAPREVKVFREELLQEGVK